MMDVKIISRETIKPSHKTPNHLHYLQSTIFDQINPPVLMPMIFFFTPQNNSITTNQTILNQLKASLPYTLSLFYPLAGRIKDKNGININDEGVPFVEAQVVNNTCVNDIVHKLDPSQFHLLLHYATQKGITRTLLAIQITTFPCGGLSIGVETNHSISDAFSKFMFVKTWASITKNDPHSNLLPRPYFDIWKVFPFGMDAQTMPNPRSGKFIKPVTKRFIVTEHKLNALRAKVKLYSSKNVGSSLIMILSAFIWSRVMMACRANDHSRPCQVFQAINLRSKVKPPEQCYYFGNMVVNTIATMPSIMSSLAGNYNDNDNDSFKYLGDFSDRMKESIDKIVKDDGFIRDIKSGREDLRLLMEMIKREIKGEISVLGFSNLRSLPVYEADFGWGKPVWVTPGSLVFKDMVFFIPSGPYSQDIDVYISLRDEEEMAKLLNDREFLSFFGSTVHGSISSKL